MDQTNCVPVKMREGFAIHLKGSRFGAVQILSNNSGALFVVGLSRGRVSEAFGITKM